MHLSVQTLEGWPASSKMAHEITWNCFLEHDRWLTTNAIDLVEQERHFVESAPGRYLRMISHQSAIGIQCWLCPSQLFTPVSYTNCCKQEENHRDFSKAVSQTQRQQLLTSKTSCLLSLCFYKPSDFPPHAASADSALPPWGQVSSRICQDTRKALRLTFWNVFSIHGV